MSSIPRLDPLVQDDSRILTVYLKARRWYDRDKRAHHNFQHVLRDLYRALLIAQTEEGVDYSILIPAVLLHDIGFSDPDFAVHGHDVTGSALAREMLAEAGYSNQDTDLIAHCIRAHKGKAEIPRTIEAKIVYDADVLEKSGVTYLILGGRIISEFDEGIEDFLNRETADRSSELDRGFYTAKARELDAGRLARTRDLLDQSRKEFMAERIDYAITESDLWRFLPVEIEDG